MSLKFAIFWHTYYRQLGFSSEIEVPQLGSAEQLHGSGSLELEKSNSNSSLLIMHQESFLLHKTDEHIAYKNN